VNQPERRLYELNQGTLLTDVMRETNGREPMMWRESLNDFEKTCFNHSEPVAWNVQNS
jgi:hypothetical protein